MYVDCPTRDCRTQIFIGSIHAASEVRCGGCEGTFTISDLMERRVAMETRVEVVDPGFVIYDLETTGLSADDCEIIQIAAVRYRAGEILRNERFFTYVKPVGGVPSHITDLTGVTNQQVHNAPSQKEAIIAFSKFVGDASMIAHNGSRFDSKFMEATCLRHGIPSREVTSIDSIHLSQSVFGIREGLSHGMDAVLGRLALSTMGHTRHDARGDVELLAQVVQILHRRLELDPRMTGMRTHVTVMPAL